MGHRIASSKQLAVGLEVAFSNTPAPQDRVAELCGGVGRGWRPSYTIRSWIFAFFGRPSHNFTTWTDPDNPMSVVCGKP